MKLFLLRRVDAEPDTRLLTGGRPVYDCANGFVVRASDESEARGFASDQCGEEGSAAWRMAEYSICQELPKDGNAGIILRDFHAG